MSYPMYNPCFSGTQNTSEGQNKPSVGQSDGNILRTIPNTTPGSSLHFLETSSGNPFRFGNRVVGQSSFGASFPVINRPEPSQMISDVNLQSTVKISARNQIGYQPIGQGALFSSMQREMSLSTTTESSYNVSSVSKGHQQTSDGRTKSFNWFPDCRQYTDTSNESSYLNPSDYPVQPTGQPLLHESVCTPQLAEKILMQYGFQKEDLYELINCPDEETTAENLPYTLQKIRKKNANRVSPVTTSQSTSKTTGSEMDISATFGKPRLTNYENPSISSDTVQVAEYRHTGQSYPQTCGNPLLIDIINTSSQDKEVLEPHLQLETSGWIPSHDNVGSATTFSLTRNVVPAHVQTQSKQTSQSVIPAFPVQNKNLKNTVPFGFPLAKTPIHPFISKAPPSSNISQAEPVMHTENNTASCKNVESKTQEREPTIAPQKDVQKQSQLEITHAAEPTALGPVLPPSLALSVTDAVPNVVSPSVPTLDLVKSTVVEGPKLQSPVKPVVFKGLPALAKMHDYTATKPRKFSHMCSLCEAECSQMKDWIDHQQTSLHLENSKRLRQQYPEWDGKIPLQSDAVRSSKISSSASDHASQDHKTKCSDRTQSHCNRRSSSSKSPPRRRSSRHRRTSTSSSSSSQSPPKQSFSRDKRVSSSSSRSQSPQKQHSSRYRKTTARSSSCSHSLHRRRSSRHRRTSISSSSTSPSPHRQRSSRHRRTSSSSSSSSHSPHRLHGKGSSAGSFERQRGKWGNRLPVLPFRRHSFRYKTLGSTRKYSELRRSPRKSCSPKWGRNPRLSPRKGPERRSPSGGAKEPRELKRSDAKRGSRRSRNQQLPSRGRGEKSQERSCDKRCSSRTRRERQCSPNKASNKLEVVKTGEQQSKRNRVGQSLPNTNHGRQSLSKKCEKLPSASRSHEQRLSAEASPSQKKLCTSSEGHSSPNRIHGKPSISKNCEMLSPVSQSQKEQLSPEGSKSEKKSCTEKMLQEGLINSAFSVPEQLNCAVVFEPIVDAEQAQEKESLSSQTSLTSPTKKIEASTSSGAGLPSFTSKPAMLNVTTEMEPVQTNVPGSKTSSTSTSKPQFGHVCKSSPPTMLRLKGNFDTLAHSDVITAMESFGKTKSLLLFKSKQEIIVCFEKEEDAAKIKSVKTVEIKGASLTLVTKQDEVCDAPLRTSAVDLENLPKTPALSRQYVSAGNFVLLPIKTLLSMRKTSKKSTAVKLVKKSKVLVSKGKGVSKKQAAQNVKTVNVASKQSATSAKEQKEAPKPEKTPNPGKPGQESNKTSEMDADASANEVKEEIQKTGTATRLTLTENNESSMSRVKGVSETKVLESESSGNPPPSQKIKEVAAKPSDMSSNFTQSETPDSHTGISKTKEGVTSENLLKVLETVCDTDEKTEPTHFSFEIGNVTDAKSLKLESARAVEAMKADSLVGEHQKPADRKFSQPKPEDAEPAVGNIGTAAGKPSYSPSLRQQLDTDNPETWVEASKQEPQTAGRSVEPPSETTPTVLAEEKETNQKESTTKTRTNDAIVLTTAAKKKQPGIPACMTSLTAGERIVPQLKLESNEYVTAESFLGTGTITVDSTLLLITNLPVYNSVRYTEEEIANLLCGFGFQYEHDHIYIFPQGCMAFVLMPNSRSVMDLVVASVHNRLILKQRKLLLHVVKKDISMTPLGFYISIMKLAYFEVQAPNVIYIRNIPPNDVVDVREALRTIGGVRNFLPLLNKVFVEFDSVCDADRLGVWYSLLKVGFTHTVERLRLPTSSKKSQPPKSPLNALPDCDEIIAGAEIPNVKYGIPQGTSPPFWVTMTTIPYVFPTASPWFNIPDFLTVRGKKDLSTTPHPGSAYCTVMLTGLPEGNYKHEDVAKLVWDYFPNGNLQTLYYNILVLPLQRRAFVFFCDRETCCRFVLDHVKKPVSVRSCTLSVHFVLQDIRPGTSEQIVYRAMMKWSNAYPPELDVLEERLLLVGISELNVDLIMSVMKEVASIASFVNFLPLANRICIEMLEPRGVKKVQEQFASTQDLLTHRTWGKVKHVESLKDLKKRLEDSVKITFNLEASATRSGAQPPAVDARTPLPSSETSHNVSQSQSKPEPAPSTESMPSKTEGTPEETVDISKLHAEPVGRPPESAEVTKLRASADAPGASKCEATLTESVSDSCNVSEPAEDSGNGSDRNVSKTKEEFVADGEHPPGLPQQEAGCEDSAAGSPAASVPAAECSEEANADEIPPASAEKPEPRSLPASQTNQSSTAAVAARSVPGMLSTKGPWSAPDPLTVGEKLGSLMLPEKIDFLTKSVVTSTKPRLLLISNLPEYRDGRYTEADIVGLLRRFGFQHREPNLYVIPHACLAFVLMPSYQCVQQVFKASQNESLALSGSKLCAHIVVTKFFMAPFEFYKSVMDLVGFSGTDDGTSTIYIQNIPPSEARNLRDTLRKIHSVKNYLPLLNKVFIEFETSRDADRIGVWYSLLKRRFKHNVYRIKLPRSDSTALPPRLAPRALPDADDIVAGPIVPATSFGVPPGSTAPFSVTMTTAPFIFPTASPWFIIPNFRTITRKKDLWGPGASIMLTGLPEGNYKHQDVAQLVWPYFPKQSLQTLLYNIVVLPLQRRAFVHFNDWQFCCSFVENFLQSARSVKDCRLYVHQVLQEMPTVFSEELMYRNTMKWSNASVPELQGLEERLLVVGVSHISVPLIIAVLKRVTDVGPVVSFLPLANRICIEMADQSLVIKAEKKIKVWTNVQFIESVKSLKGRLKRCAEITIHLDQYNTDIWTKAAAVKSDVNVDVSHKKKHPGVNVVSADNKDAASATKTKNVPENESVDKTTEEGSEMGPEKIQETQAVRDYVQPPVCKGAKSSEMNQTEVKGLAAAEEDKPRENQPPTVKSDSIFATRSTSQVDRVSPVITKDPATVKVGATNSPESLTPGEKTKISLNTTGLKWLSVCVSSSEFLSLDATLVISNLPEFSNGCYTEAEVIALLSTYGLRCEDDEIFIIPQSRIAFVFSPNMEVVQKLMMVKNKVLFKKSKLHFGVIESHKPHTAFGVYQFLMGFTSFKNCLPTRVLYIQKISFDEARNLREDLKKIGSMINYLPLLNKVFVEFQTALDADRLGVWHGFLKHGRSYVITRLGVPTASSKSKPPRMPSLALMNNYALVAKASTPLENAVVPIGCTPPFWVTMTTKPFLFPTASPWFNIPAYWELSSMENLRKCMLGSFIQPTVMLTGLSSKTYTHEDVAALVWKYFPERNLHAFNYNVMVLPLQRRAFVCFHSWDACSSFFQDHLTTPISFKGSTAYVYLVRDSLLLADDEESLYITMMKWSNTHVAEPAGLEERLLCVEVAGIDRKTVMMVMNEVANIDAFTNFLPLANRIYIEMKTSRGVTKVVEKLVPTRLCKKCGDWKQVGRIEPISSRKWRLQRSKNIPVNLELDTNDIKNDPTTEKSADQLENEATSSDSPTPTASESATGSSDPATKEKREAKETVVSASEKAQISTTCSTPPIRSLVQSEEKNADLIKVNAESFDALKTLVLQFRSQPKTFTKHQEICSENDSSKSEGSQTADILKTESPRKNSNSDVFPEDARPSTRSSNISSSPSSSPPSKSQKRTLSAHTKPSARGQKTSSSSSSSDSVKPSSKGGQSPSSSSGERMSVKRHLSQKKESAEVTSDYKGFAERKTELKSESLSEIDPSAEENKSEISDQNQSLESTFTDKTTGEISERKEEQGRINEDGRSIEGNAGEENCPILDPLNEQIGKEKEKKEKQDVGSKIHLPGSEIIRNVVQRDVKDKTCSKTVSNAACQDQESGNDGHEKHQVKDECLKVKPDKRTSKSISEGRERSPVKKKGGEQCKTQTMDRWAAEIYRDPVEDESVTERSTGRSTKRFKGDDTTQSKADTNEPAITTRSTRAGRKTASKEGIKDETPTTRRSAPANDPQKQHKNKTQKTEEETTRITREQKPSLEISDDLRESEEGQQEAATSTRTRGQTRKTAGLTPVRKSTRGIQSETPLGKTQRETGEEGKDIQVSGKRKTRLSGPQAKRSCVAADIELPPFNPETALGKEFVNRRWGYFCNLCSVSYLNESGKEDQHCKSQLHYDNLQKYYRERRRLRTSTAQKQNSA